MEAMVAIHIARTTGRIGDRDISDLVAVFLEYLLQCSYENNPTEVLSFTYNLV